MDRSLLEGDPTLSSKDAHRRLCHRSQEGYVYCRAEYPLAIRRLKIAIAQAEGYGLLGEDILGTNHSFRIKLKEERSLRLRRGDGSYSLNRGQAWRAQA